MKGTNSHPSTITLNIVLILQLKDRLVKGNEKQDLTMNWPHQKRNTQSESERSEHDIKIKWNPKASRCNCIYIWQNWLKQNSKKR